MGRRWQRVVLGGLALLIGGVVWMAPVGSERPPHAFAAPRSRPKWDPGSNPGDARAVLLRQARVWTATDPSGVDLAANPRDPSGALSASVVRCQYLSNPARGTTAKFDCVLADGEIVKVKYGGTGEIPAEVAATRLLAALGFGADRMYLVPRLRCYGCLRSPFYAVWALDYVRARDVVARSIPDDRFTDFEWVAVERRLDGTAVETDAVEGWSWYELVPSDAERDALRLMAMFLAHWDNKAANQRLIVRPEPFAYIHDLGATFGPNKMNVDHWRDASIWSDRSACTVSMKPLPYGGGTFPDARVSEAGRALLARQLTALSDRQIEGLFTAARFTDVRAWVRAFQERVRQISEAGPCG